MDIHEFRKSINGKKPETYEIRNSYGVKDYLKYYRSIKPDKPSFVLKPEQFYKILRKVGDILCESIKNGEDLVFPEKMGEILTTKRKAKDFFDGKFRTTRYVNWGATLDLWYESPEDYKNRTLIYREEDTYTTVKYSVRNAHYANKMFYDFHLTKYITRNAGKRNNTEFDKAVLLNTDYGNSILDLYRHDR